MLGRAKRSLEDKNKVGKVKREKKGQIKAKTTTKSRRGKRQTYAFMAELERTNECMYGKIDAENTHGWPRHSNRVFWERVRTV